MITATDLSNRAAQSTITVRQSLLNGALMPSTALLDSVYGITTAGAAEAAQNAYGIGRCFEKGATTAQDKPKTPNNKLLLLCN